jgi:predicted Zn-ribbon and HTH transcriptional regulator
LLELSRLKEFYQKCSFVAKFERGIYEGQTVSVATRPTDIEFTLRPEKEDEAPLWMTTAPCPYCGKPLRTKKAKQCPHCFNSWHNENA